MDRKRLRIDSEFQSKKSGKRYIGDDDRISQLPDDILVDILSLLPLKEAAHTSVHSCRWINLWKHTSCLKFDTKESKWDVVGVEKIRRVINPVLQSHKAMTLNEFRICCDLMGLAEKEFTEWLAYAFSRKVEKLELDLSWGFLDFDAYVFAYPFPEQLLAHQPLVNFKYLRALSLKSIGVSGEAIKFFLRNSPLLEKLIVHEVNDLSNLEVCGSSLELKHLEICDCEDLKFIKVLAPNLTSLKVPILPELLLENVPMLVDLYVTCGHFDNYVRHLVPALSRCISRLDILTLAVDKYEKIINFPEMPAMPKLKKLVMECGAMSDESLISLSSLIRASPYLQEFVLKFSWCYVPSSDREVKNKIRFPHEHLKVVRFCG